MKKIISFLLILCAMPTFFFYAMESSSSGAQLSQEYKAKLFDLYYLIDHWEEEANQKFKKLIQEINVAFVDGTISIFGQETPFFRALKISNNKAAELLLKNGYVNEGESKIGLQLSIMDGNIDLVRTLCDTFIPSQGLNLLTIDVHFQSGITLLHIIPSVKGFFDTHEAIIHRIKQAMCIEYILKNLYDAKFKDYSSAMEYVFSIRDKDGHTPMDLARIHNPYALLVFIKYGAPFLVPNDLQWIAEANVRLYEVMYELVL